MRTLELFGLQWLRFEKRCPVVLWERSPREWECGRPDLLGITEARFLIEIETKRTVADFRANQIKRHVGLRAQGLYLDQLPKQYYFLVTPDICEAVIPLVPEWAGLMRGPENMEVQQPFIIKQAPVNKEAKKLCVKETIHAVKLMANQCFSVAIENHDLKRKIDQNR